MKLPFWNRRKNPPRQGFRVQLDSLVRDLRFKLGDVPAGSEHHELLQELDRLEAEYLRQFRDAQRQLSPDRAC